MFKKIAVVVIAVVVSFNASAMDCSDDARLSTALKVGAVGLAAGATIGLAAASTIPVGAVGGPLSVVYFTGVGSAAFGNWMAATVVPMMTLGGTLTGTAFGGTVYATYKQACETTNRRLEAAGESSKKAIHSVKDAAVNAKDRIAEMI